MKTNQLKRILSLVLALFMVIGMLPAHVHAAEDEPIVLIGNGSQNISVTYSSTSSRCELSFTNSGEALTIAAAGSNPSDADSDSFAIYDSEGYYWQYNTSATLIYGNTSDNYLSRFHFYERVENTASEPEEDKGWISLPSNGTYVLDTDGMDPGARYIVVGQNNDYALTVSGGTVSQSKVTISNSKLKVGSYYLRYSGGSVSLKSSATTTYCFIEE